MILGIIQLIGIFLASVYGMAIIIRLVKKLDLHFVGVWVFGIGMVMAFSGLIF
jgi:Mg2+ and Co2+ transporter CorA